MTYRALRKWLRRQRPLSVTDAWRAAGCPPFAGGAGTGKATPPPRYPSALPTVAGYSSTTVNWGPCGGVLSGSAYIAPFPTLSVWIGNTATALVTFSGIAAINSGDALQVDMTINGGSPLSVLFETVAGSGRSVSASRLLTSANGIVANSINTFSVYASPCVSASTAMTSVGSLIVQPLS